VLQLLVVSVNCSIFNPVSEHMQHVTHYTCGLHCTVLHCAVLQLLVGLSERAGESLPFVLVAAKDDLGMSNVSQQYCRLWI
jgi:hypothetical protein